MNSLHLPIIVTLLIVFSITPLGNAETEKETHLVPSWIKHNALWWSQEEISDDDFINGIRWLVENRILPITDPVKKFDDRSVMDSVKKISYAWSQDKTTDIEFLRGVEYLIKNGMMDLDGNFVSQIIKERLEQISVKDDVKKSVVIIPVFTASAYLQHQFYDYFGGQCDIKCLTTPVYSQIPLGYTASGKAADVLQTLGYYTVTDIDVDKNPEILSQYDKVIVLHNEYVTQNEFDAITSHPHVIYLYPNALYAKVYADYTTNTITLVRGHGYPDISLRNGFDWKFDNSNLEYDIQCKDWKFYPIDNGIMLNCYPENHLADNIGLLKAMRDF